MPVTHNIVVTDDESVTVNTLCIVNEVRSRYTCNTTLWPLDGEPVTVNALCMVTQALAIPSQENWY